MLSSVSELVPISADDFRARFGAGRLLHTQLEDIISGGNCSDDLLNDNPAVPGGLLKSKPTWGSISGCASPRRLFFR